MQDQPVQNNPINPSQDPNQGDNQDQNQNQDQPQVASPDFSQPHDDGQTEPTQPSYVDAYDGGVSAPPSGDANMMDLQQDMPLGAPPVSANPQPTQPQPASATTISETLEDQNIFFLLGVQDGTEAQKEAFLDELQQVIWEDFLENDVQLLLTKEEHSQLQQMLGGDTKKPLVDQEEVVVFLEKLIPDLEEIMLEKALELKADLVKERLAGLKTLHAEKPEELRKVDEAEQLVSQDKWLSAARVLNSLA